MRVTFRDTYLHKKRSISDQSSYILFIPEKNQTFGIYQFLNIYFEFFNYCPREERYNLSIKCKYFFPNKDSRSDDFKTEIY